MPKLRQIWYALHSIICLNLTVYNQFTSIVNSAVQEWLVRWLDQAYR